MTTAAKFIKKYVNEKVGGFGNYCRYLGNATISKNNNIYSKVSGTKIYSIPKKRSDDNINECVDKFENYIRIKSYSSLQSITEVLTA